MTREQIERAAGEYSGSVLGFKDNPVVMNKHKAFMDGAQWRINSVWHDAIDKPENGRFVLVDKEYRIYDVWKQDICDDWLNDVNYFGVKRWAYLDDLLPEREEETK